MARVPSVDMIVILPLALLFMFVPLAMFIRNGQRRREWEHAERMKALEMGLPVPPRDAPWAKAAVCVAIGAVVPMIAFASTYLAFAYKSEVASAIWIAPALVSGASVIGACILAGTIFRGGSTSAHPSAADGTNGRYPGVKPSHDPDAVDVVGSRG